MRCHFQVFLQLSQKYQLNKIVTPPLDEFGEIRGIKMSKTTTARSWKEKENGQYKSLSKPANSQSTEIPQIPW